MKYSIVIYQAWLVHHVQSWSHETYGQIIKFMIIDFSSHSREWMLDSPNRPVLVNQSLQKLNLTLIFIMIHVHVIFFHFLLIVQSI